MKFFFLNSFAILFLLLSLINCQVNKEMENNVKEMQETLKLSKTASCFTLIRNYLEDGKEKEKISKAITESGKDKNAFYDKMVLTMLKQCIKKIEQKAIDEIETAKNILTMLPKYKPLIEVNLKEIKDVSLDAEDLEIMKEMENISNKNMDPLASDDELKFFGINLKNNKNISLVFALIGFILFVVIVLGGLYKLDQRKKEKEKKKHKKNK